MRYWTQNVRYHPRSKENIQKNYNCSGERVSKRMSVYTYGENAKKKEPSAQILYIDKAFCGVSEQNGITKQNTTTIHYIKQFSDMFQLGIASLSLWMAAAVAVQCVATSADNIIFVFCTHEIQDGQRYTRQIILHKHVGMYDTYLIFNYGFLTFQKFCHVWPSERKLWWCTVGKGFDKCENDLM